MITRSARLKHTATAAILMVWAVSVSGCGSAAPYAESSLTEAKVSGQVTAAGKPVTRGQVIFDPANVKRPSENARTAEIHQDGRYELNTLIGSNRVTVAIPSRPARKATHAPDVQKIFEVQTGDNTFDIAMP